MDTEYTAKLLRISDPYYEPEKGMVYKDTIAVYNGDVVVNLINVYSNSDPHVHDNAVAKVLGTHDFKWLN